MQFSFQQIILMHWYLDLPWSCMEALLFTLCLHEVLWLSGIFVSKVLQEGHITTLDERRTVNIKALMDINDNEHEKVREVLEGCAELDNSQIRNSKFWSAHKDCRLLRRHSYTVAV